MNTFFSFCLLLLVAVALHGQSFTDPVRINPADGDTDRQDGATIQVDRNGAIYVAWSDFQGSRDGDVFMRASTDGGSTFSAPTPMFIGGSAPAGSRRGAEFVVAPDGTIHAVRLITTGTSSTDVEYVRSTDGGASFSQPVSLTGDDDDAAQDYPCIAVDSSGIVYVAYVDNRDKHRGESYYDHIYFTRSTDKGTSFTEPKRISLMPDGKGGSCECCNTGIAASPEGDVYVAFRSNVDNNRDVYIARSRDAGQTFDTAIRAASESWKIFACPMAGPSIALDREGTAHVAWKDVRGSAGGKQYVYYTTLRKAASACALDYRISESMIRANYPSLGITPDGAILCATENVQSGETGAYYLYSLDGGNSFGQEMTLAGAALLPGTPVVAVGPDGTRYVVWRDSRAGTHDIWFAKDSSPLALKAPESVALNTPSNGATLDNFWYFAWNPPANLERSSHVVYDLSYTRQGGQTELVEGLQGTSYEAALEPGTYEWNVRARTLAGSSPVSPAWTFTFARSGVVDTKGSAAGWRLALTPNVAHGATNVTLAVTAPETGDRGARISLVDPVGREVRLLHDGALASGVTRIETPVTSLPSGLYHCVVRGAEVHLLQSLVIVR